MKTSTILGLILLLGGTCTTFADVGDTLEQARKKYGAPSGEMQSGAQTIRIYKTPLGIVTETYNAKGTCVDSDADQLPAPWVLAKPQLTPVSTPLPQPKTALPQTSRPHVISISEEERASRPDMQPIPAAPSPTTSPAAPWKKVLPPVLIAIALATIAGAAGALLRRKADSPVESVAAGNDIRALCDFKQRKYERKPLQQSQPLRDS